MDILGITIINPRTGNPYKPTTIMECWRDFEHCSIHSKHMAKMALVAKDCIYIYMIYAYM